MPFSFHAETFHGNFKVPMTLKNFIGLSESPIKNQEDCSLPFLNTVKTGE